MIVRQEAAGRSDTADKIGIESGLVVEPFPSEGAVVVIRLCVARGNA